MEIKKYALAAALIIISVSSYGCFEVSDEFTGIKEHLLKGTKTTCKKESEFALGKGTFAFAKLFVSREEDPEASDFLNNISLVQVGVYRLKSAAHDTKCRNLIDLMEQQGWNYIVKNKSQREFLMVFVKSTQPETINAAFIIECKNNKLSLVEVHGNLDKIIETAIKKREPGLGFVEN
jgi:hypothetical protein